MIRKQIHSLTALEVGFSRGQNPLSVAEFHVRIAVWKSSQIKLPLRHCLKIRLQGTSFTQRNDLRLRRNCCCLVAQSTLCNPMDCSVPGFLVLPYLLELLKLIAIELVVSSNHLILCHPILLLPSIFCSFPGDPGGKESACNTGDPGSAPGLGRSPGEGNGNPLQYSCLENPMDRGAWRPTVYGVTKSRTRLSN